MKADGQGLRSGEVVDLTGLSSDTLRHYERAGILPIAARTPSGYRIYSRDAIDRVRLVQRALKLGFTLKELAEILKMRDSGGVPCHRVLKTTEQKLRSVERQIGELRQIQRYMRSLIREWRLKLAEAPPGRKALLLESLADRAPLRTPPRNNLKSE